MSFGSMSLMRDGRSPPPEKPTLLEPGGVVGANAVDEDDRLRAQAQRADAADPGHATRPELAAGALDLKAGHGNGERFLHPLARCGQLRRRHVDDAHDIAERAHLGVAGLAGDDEFIESQRASRQQNRHVGRANGGRLCHRLMSEMRDDQGHCRPRQSDEREPPLGIRPRTGRRALGADYRVGEGSPGEGVGDDPAYRARLSRPPTRAGRATPAS